MNPSMASYLPILYFAIMAAIVPVAGLAAMSLLRPSKPTPTKLAPYECGVASPTEAFDHRFSVRYYLIAVLFVVFDVETIFLFPWAVMYHKLEAVRPRRDARLPRDPRRRLRLRLAAGGSFVGLIENSLPDNVLTTTVDAVIDWGRKNSLWPMQFGLACCAIEMMAVVDSRARHRALRRRGLPRLAAPVRPHDRRRHRDREDGADHQAPLRPDGRPEVGHRHGLLRDLRRPVPTATRSRRASTGSCRWTSTSPAARRGPRRSSTALMELQKKIAEDARREAARRRSWPLADEPKDDLAPAAGEPAKRRLEASRRQPAPGAAAAERHAPAPRRSSEGGRACEAGRARRRRRSPPPTDATRRAPRRRARGGRARRGRLREGDGRPDDGRGRAATGSSRSAATCASRGVHVPRRPHGRRLEGARPALRRRLLAPLLRPRATSASA